MSTDAFANLTLPDTTDADKAAENHAALSRLTGGRALVDADVWRHHKPIDLAATLQRSANRAAATAMGI